MGIRYYAYPITSDQYPAAREDPCPFHGTDPLMDAWGPLEDRPEMLYLDKCWREFQILLGPDSGSIDRPALQLVDGEVTHVPMGWIAYERALSPAQVRDVATDLATVNDSDVRRMLPAFSRRGGSEPDDLDYVTVYLAAAREFVDRLANDGRGLVYLIG